MKKFVHGLLYLLLPLFTLAQQSEHLRWEVKAEKLNDTSYNLIAEINIQPNWHVYAETDAETGIDALQLEWDNENIIATGGSQFSNTPSVMPDPVFDNKKFSVFLPGKLILTQKINIRGTIPASQKIGLKGFAASNTEFLPIDKAPKAVAFEGGVEQSAKDQIKLSTIDLNNPVQPCGDAHAAGKSIWIVFLLGLGGGFIALLTPCVFPMIPVTVSFFTNRASNRNQAVKNGVLYGFFIFSYLCISQFAFSPDRKCATGNIQ